MGRLLEQVDWPRFHELAARQQLLGLALLRSDQFGPGASPLWFREAAESWLARRRRRALLADSVTAHVVGQLEDAGVPTVPIKGATLGARLYDDPGVRTGIDIDLLVSASRYERATAALVAGGHEALGGNSALHRRFRSGFAAPFAIELHWRVDWFESAFSEQLVARSRPGSSGLREPSPDDVLTVLLLCWVRDGLVGLRYPADIASWCDRFGGELHPQVVRRTAAAHPQLRRTLAVGAVTAAAVVGAPSAPAPALDLRSRLATRLNNWTLRGGRDQAAVNGAIVDGLVAPPGALGGVARRQLRRTGEGAAGAVTHPVKLAARTAAVAWTVRSGRVYATTARSTVNGGLR